MYNMILDKLPTEYEGYLIRTSFRIGIQICLCANDPDYTEEERLYIMLNLLYGEGIPKDIKLATAGLNWFISCGQEQHNTNANQKELFYWDYDNARLYSSFMSTYNIDITREDMHWFKFIALIGSLRKDSAFNGAVQVRGYDMSDLKGKARMEMQKMKQELAPPIKYSAEEQARIDEFNALLEGDVNG